MQRSSTHRGWDADGFPKAVHCFHSYSQSELIPPMRDFLADFWLKLASKFLRLRTEPKPLARDFQPFQLVDPLSGL